MLKTAETFMGRHKTMEIEKEFDENSFALQKIMIKIMNIFYLISLEDS